LFDLWVDNMTTVDQHIFFMSSDSNVNVTDGYSVSIEYGAVSNLTLYRWNSLARVILDRTELPSIPPSWVSFNVTRTDDGHFIVKRDGSQDLSGDDSTIWTSAYFVFQVWGSGVRLDNLTVAALSVVTSPTGTTTTTTTSSTTTPTPPPNGPIDFETIVKVGLAGLAILGVPAAALQALMSSSLAYTVRPSLAPMSISQVQRQASLEYWETMVLKKKKKQKPYELTVYLHREGADLIAYKEEHKVLEAQRTETLDKQLDLPDASEVEIKVRCKNAALLSFSPERTVVKISKRQEVVHCTIYVTPKSIGESEIEIEFRVLGEIHESIPRDVLKARVEVAAEPFKIRGRPIPRRALHIWNFVLASIAFVLVILVFVLGVELPSNLQEYAAVSPFLAIIVTFFVATPVVSKLNTAILRLIKSNSEACLFSHPRLLGCEYYCTPRTQFCHGPGPSHRLTERLNLFSRTQNYQQRTQF
jgi:hypothetical protein